jgi:hypothetical protein
MCFSAMKMLYIMANTPVENEPDFFGISAS